jgi:hypothetical protein
MDRDTETSARRASGAAAYGQPRAGADEAYDRGTPLRADRLGRPDDPRRRGGLGVYLEDGIVLLGILVGGAAGYAAAASVRSSDRGPTYTHGRSRKRETADLMRETRRRQGGEPVEDEETHELIASDKVEGTAVYGRDGEKIGTVHNFMVGKRSGVVAYAVVGIGGFLGLGEIRHALPWGELDYDEGRKGYRVRATKEELKNAPHHGPGEDAFSRPDYSAHVRSYWAARRPERHASGMPTAGAYHA